MAKLDRLGWADGLSFSAYGVRVGLRVNDKAILKRVLTRLPPGAKPADARVVNHLYSLTGFANNSNGKLRRFNLGYWNLARFARTRSFEDLLDGFESHLQLMVAEYAPRHVFVHADRKSTRLNSSHTVISYAVFCLKKKKKKKIKQQ